MKTVFKVLTQKKAEQSHRETLVTIDWTGVTHEQLMTLAKWALTADMQARFVKSNSPIPDKWDIKACEQVKQEPAALWAYQPPKKKDPMEELLAKMNPKEREALLAELRATFS